MFVEFSRTDDRSRNRSGEIVRPIDQVNIVTRLSMTAFRISLDISFSLAISFLFLLLVYADSFTSTFGVAQYYIGSVSHAFLAYSDGFGLTRLIIRFFYW